MYELVFYGCADPSFHQLENHCLILMILIALKLTFLGKIRIALLPEPGLVTSGL